MSRGRGCPAVPHRPFALVVISYPGRKEVLFEQAALHFARAAGPTLAVERCQDPEEVLFLARTWKRRGRSIERLDLLGHGDGGRFELGDGLLFASDGTGYGLVRPLGVQLGPRAQLRLLGCNVARLRHPKDPLPFSGPTLLADLQARIGANRRVLASTAFLGPADWGATGLTARAEALMVGV